MKLENVDLNFLKNLVEFLHLLILTSLLSEETKCDIEERTFKRGGYHCNSNCINENIGYKNWSMAWNKCAEIECCTRIFRRTNGSHFYYHLRKADDIFDNDPKFHHINFNHVCRGKALYF